MTAFTFSIDQLRSAPPEVRRWFAIEIARALNSVEAPHPEPRHTEAMTLAACTPTDALQIFELIAADAVAGRLFFELGREHAASSAVPELRTLRIADLLHHAGLPDENGLVAALSLIDRAYRELHGTHAGNLFGFDDAGHLFLHQATQESIRQVWEQLVRARAAAEREVLGTAPRPGGFVAPRLGPSEDIAAHAAPQRAGAEPYS